ncbi:MAG: hypothetical protein EXX96DRAFT_556068 [Benjaminiella poitrasii]|nr:MAG: hypothetical protein EXX96DRAFT_556068 [Benjaminiella poitrasii]
MMTLNQKFRHILPPPIQVDFNNNTAATTQWTSAPFKQVHLSPITSPPHKKRRPTTLMNQKPVTWKDINDGDNNRQDKQSSMPNALPPVIRRVKSGDKLSDKRKRMNRRAIIYIPNPSTDILLQNSQERWTLYCVTYQKLRNKKSLLPFLEFIHLRNMLATLEQQDRSLRPRYYQQNHLNFQQNYINAMKQQQQSRSQFIMPTRQPPHGYYPHKNTIRPPLKTNKKWDAEEDNVPLVKLIDKRKQRSPSLSELKQKNNNFLMLNNQPTNYNYRNDNKPFTPYGLMPACHHQYLPYFYSTPFYQYHNSFGSRLPSFV